MTDGPAPLRALALVCSLKPSPAPSSSALIAAHVVDTLTTQGADCETIRCVDFDIAPGVEADMGNGDQWPQIRAKVLDADILLLSTPIWLGHPSSVTQRVLERLDAELSNKDADGRPVMTGKVAIVSVVGNEDGAHKVIADVFQALNDVGFTIPANSGIYWVGEAMGDINYVDLKEVPDVIRDTIDMAASNAAHLARVLQAAAYPGLD